MPVSEAMIILQKTQDDHRRHKVAFGFRHDHDSHRDHAALPPPPSARIVMRVQGGL